MKIFFSFIALTILFNIRAQSYTSYFTGDTSDVQVQAQGGICLMGGASEDDNAMIWFLNGASGGDVLVFRASGSDGYNNYFYSGLGVAINSVETIVFNNASAANNPYIHQRIQQAEAIWFAGGDQWDYISYWRGTAIDSLINLAIQDRNIVIGGTSAGMAIQGGYYFSAENGTVTSNTALSNPYDLDVTVDSGSFLKNDILHDVITDTHYDNPDRKGRQVVFLSRMWEMDGIYAKGIACDEYTAVCIDTNGIASVYGEYPTYDDFAYFLQVNCENSNPAPENLSNGQPLTWDLNQTAIKVYRIGGNTTGNNSFDLNDWKTASGGDWYNWYVQNDALAEQSSQAPNCNVNNLPEADGLAVKVYPNPTKDYINIEFEGEVWCEIYSLEGRLILSSSDKRIYLGVLDRGTYIIKLGHKAGISTQKVQVY